MRDAQGRERGLAATAPLNGFFRTVWIFRNEVCSGPNAPPRVRPQTASFGLRCRDDEQGDGMGHSTTLGYRFSGRRIATLIAAAAALAVAAALLVAVLGPVSQAPATHVAPVVQPGNPSCPGGTTTLTIQAGDIDDLGVGESRTFNQGALSVTITVTAVNAEGEPTAFSFTSNSPVTRVIVKGGPNANVYTYAAPGVTSDTGLTAPDGKGISHISFCFPPPPVTTTSTSTTTTTAPTTTTTTAPTTTTTTAPTTTTK